MVYTVGYITQYIGSLLRADRRLSDLTVSGEVSNVTDHPSGHIYFTLKDADAQMQAVMFRGDRGGLLFPMKPGDQVVVKGEVRIYGARGTYQLYAKHIEPAGLGDLYLAFERLKKELAESGMFDEGYKKPLPKNVQTLGIVTAPNGAAVRDMIRIAKRRFPYIQIYLYPAVVQGERAAESIVRGIRTLEQKGVDVMIVGRGGGSIEDLWAFNEEEVARAIFACSIPVVSAVGHETDFTIADFVADKRAATPSEAAEIAVFDYTQFKEDIEGLKWNLIRSMLRKIETKRSRTHQIQKNLYLLSPGEKIRQKRMRLIELEERLALGIDSQIRMKRSRMERIAAAFVGLSPAARLSAGYAHVTDTKGKTIKDAAQLNVGDPFIATLYHGSVEASVTKVHDDTKKDGCAQDA